MLRFLSVGAVFGFAFYLILQLYPQALGLSFNSGYGRNPETADRRILFLGNSFTQSGNIHQMVGHMAASATPSADYYISGILSGGYTINNHLEDGKVQRALRSGTWDIVVVQTQSVAAFERAWHDQALEGFQELSAIARQNQVDFLWYAHWRPDYKRESYFEAAAHRKISEFYHRAARQNGGEVAEVGFAFDAAKRMGIDGLLAADDHHPSLKGSYLSALEILATLGDVDIATVTYVPRGISKDEAERLRTVVARRH